MQKEDRMDEHEKKRGVVVRIDQEVFEKLKALAHGFERPNAVIRRILGLPAVISKNRED